MPLQPNLEDFARSLAGKRYRFGLIDRHGQRSFAIDVLAGGDRVEDDLLVLVRWSRYDHSLDVRRFEQFLVVGEGLGIGGDLLRAVEI